MYQLCCHDVFAGFITFLILANTVVLALDRHPIEPAEFEKLEMLNNSFSWCFFAEMVIKLFGLGFKGYTEDKFNIFDCFVVILSTIENVLQWASLQSISGGAISAFRSVRLLRVFKLARSWSSFRELLEKIYVSLREISNFSILLLIFMFTYTLLGMEIFAYKAKFDPITKEVTNADDGVYPRENFNTFYYSFTTIFIILIGEDWNHVMYKNVRGREMVYQLFFVILYIFGNLILMNLFLAILLKNFDTPTDVSEEMLQGNYARKGTLFRMKTLLQRGLSTLNVNKKFSIFVHSDSKPKRNSMFQKNLDQDLLS